ncbi:MAG: agmatine deiminase family protein [Sulfurimonas sp.]|nr:agmatine deiminase family protein [Sulfurimonas sp.]MDD5201966.1 agmatine deiminase family protein [Sulfurimonas sp.]
MKRLIAEFEEQSFTQIIFPPKESDWSEYLKEAEENFVDIINAIIKYQKCLVVCDDLYRMESRFEIHENLYLVEQTTNDSWARDCSALCVQNGDDIELLDFTFTGWGSKFEARKDNAMSRAIAKNYSKPLKTIDLILEGGGVESDGAGTILTTSECMLNPNRNVDYTKEQTNAILKESFGATKILYLNHGYLAGDDTDSHIDTLARIISKDAIMYVKCDDTEDEHYEELRLMEKELEVISKEEGFKLIALPMSSPVYFEGERLPATYANFLFVNGAVLVPVYGVKEDAQALTIFRETFPQRDIVAIDCRVLIRQHGSLHCVTMNFAKGVELI